jgi:hypothetical protein
LIEAQAVPRQSAEAKAAATYLAGSRAPDPPGRLGAEGKTLWREISASKPPDWFDAGSLPLLESYCDLTIHARAIARKLKRLRKAGAWDEMLAFERRLRAVVDGQSMLATKLRLSVQGLIERHSRRILEHGQTTPNTKADKKPDRLLGGEAVWGKLGQSKPN